MKKFIRTSYFAIIMLMIYLPIVVMILFSFNSGSTTNEFDGWSVKWYDEFVHNSPLIKSITTSLFVAMISTIISIIIGVLAVIGLWKVKPRTKNTWLNISNIPLINADVITAASLMVTFIVMGLKFGIFTLIAAHISFNVPYVIITIMPFLKKIDKNLIDASQDLGSSPRQTLIKIILPILKPAILTATAICFAMSFDDFIISYFTGGDQVNVSTFIYTAKRIQPYINAFGTIVVAFIFLVIIIWNIITASRQKYNIVRQQIKNGEYKLKKIDRINKKIDILNNSLDKNTKIRKSKNLNSWIKYWILRLKLKILTSKNYNSLISKLEWKKERIKNTIRSEKRIIASHKRATEKQNMLRIHMENVTNKNRLSRFEIILKKLDKKINKLDNKIENINWKIEIDKNKISRIEEDLLDLGNDFINLENPTAKEKLIYQKKKSHLIKYVNELKEGRNNLKLRLTIEKLEELKITNETETRLAWEKLQKIYNKVNKEVSLTEKLDKLMKKSKKLSQEEWKLRIEDNLKLIRLKISWKIKLLNNEIALIHSKTERKKHSLFTSDEQSRTNHKSGFKKVWKPLMIGLIFTGAFTGLTSAYVLNNVYDLVIGNWGSYIDPKLINEFENEYNVKINYQQYDSNESLYNKAKTFNYDIMVPSDYMAWKMVEEGNLKKLDQNLLNINWDTNKKNEYMISSELKAKNTDFFRKSCPTTTNCEEKKLQDYAVPYFWGDVVVAFNTQKQKVNQFLKSQKTEISTKNNVPQINDISWELIWKAAEQGLNISLNEDPKNIFSLSSFKNNFGSEPRTLEEVEIIKNDLDSLIKAKNVALYGDQLINNVSVGDFDIAIIYNGDLIYAMQNYMKSNKLEKPPFAFAMPKEGINVWCDYMVVNQTNRNLDLSYNFINFINSSSKELTLYSGYTSPIQNTISSVIKNDYSQFTNLYNTKVQKGSPFKLNPEIDDAVIDAYNKLISEKN